VSVLTTAPQAHGEEVGVLVSRLRAEVDLVRQEMGRAKVAPIGFQVIQASEAAVYESGLTLHRKADLLTAETTRQRGIPISLVTGAPGRADCISVVSAALARVRVLKSALGITERSVMPSNPPVSTGDVLRDIIRANRELNGLMDRRFAPSDVYAEVTVGISYAARLLSRHPGARQIPTAPEFERRKRPLDVLRRLLRCLEIVAPLVRDAGAELVALKLPDQMDVVVAPSDVFDVAVIVTGALRATYVHSSDNAVVRRVFHPGRKLPAHVFQRVGLLERQLVELQRLRAAQDSEGP